MVGFVFVLLGNQPSDDDDDDDDAPSGREEESVRATR
jgi:hypothetical protein